MNWQVHWTNAGQGRDLMQHRDFSHTAQALEFADAQIHDGGRVYRIEGPSGEIMDESQVRIAVTQMHLDKLDHKAGSR